MVTAIAPAEPRPRALWLPLAVALAATLLFGASVATAEALGHGAPRAAVTPFGGPTAVSVPHGTWPQRVLGSAAPAHVLRVRCAGAGTIGTACFTALP